MKFRVRFKITEEKKRLKKYLSLNFVTFLCSMLGNSRFVIKIKQMKPCNKLKPCNKFRVRICQIHGNGGKKMIEEIPVLK